MFEFFKRHINKITLIIAVAAGATLVSNYASKKITEINQDLTTSRRAKANISRRFNQNQQDVLFTIKSLLPSISSTILNYFKLDSLVLELKGSRMF